MLAAEIATRPPIVVSEEATLEEAARRMLDHRIGCVLVVDASGRLTGIVTESDYVGEEHAVPFSLFRAPRVFRRYWGKGEFERLHDDARRVRVGEIATRPVFTVGEDATVQEAVEAMIRADVKRIPIVRDDVPVAVVARHDVLRLMVRSSEPRGTEATGPPARGRA